MRKIITAGILWSFFISSILPQDREPAREQEIGGHSLKKIKYNLNTKGGKDMDTISNDNYSLERKGKILQLFFGDFNAPVEFLYSPSFEGDIGFRVVKDSSNTFHMLEIKYILNFSESLYYTEAYRDKIVKIDTRHYPVSDRLAEKLYEKMVFLFDKVKEKDPPPVIYDRRTGTYVTQIEILSDGDLVTFRTVVEDKVWSLCIHEPQGSALKMSNLCRRIITDARENQLDEAKYLFVLSTFED